MQTNEQRDVIIYRIREKGLEVFLVNPAADDSDETSQMPCAQISDQMMAAGGIELDVFTSENGDIRKAIAFEADWHDIPSLRALMYEDYRVAKEKAKQHIRNLVPEMDKGAYVVIKDAFKRVMPAQYAFLKELKDIITEKNQTKYL